MLTALADNWDIRNRGSLRTWLAQSDPAYLQRLASIRASRLQTAAIAPAPSPGLPTSATQGVTLGGTLNTLAPKQVQ